MSVLRVARVPYLNTDPFFAPGAAPSGTLITLSPRQLGEAAARGQIDAGPLSVVDYFRLTEWFEPLGNLGISTLGEARSVLLFAQRPLQQLGGCAIEVTDESSTSAVLLRLLLEQRYAITPSGYHRGAAAPSSAEAKLAIGDEALRLRMTEQRMPYRIDLGQEWWLWQALPFVFALWVVRKDAPAQAKEALRAALESALRTNLQAPQAIARQHAASLGMTAQAVEHYLAGFRYRLEHADWQGLERFRALAQTLRPEAAAVSRAPVAQPAPQAARK